MEPHGELIRLRAAPVTGGPTWVDGLAADVTPAAIAELGVEPGDQVWFAVKAAEVSVHPAGRCTLLRADPRCRQRSSWRPWPTAPTVDP